MSIFEIIGVIFGVWSVYLTVKQKVLSWPVGLVSVVALGIMFFQIKLYADAMEQIYYVITGFVGWYLWKYGGEKKSELKVSLLNNKQRVIGAGIVLALSAVLGYLLDTYTDASLPYLDSVTTVMSLCAQLLLTKKIFENWILWIIVDVMALGIYTYKGVYLTTGLYVIYLVLASGGFVQWYKSLVANKKYVKETI
ncbi:MAG: nicotinamide riboside transporter PnuC [Patescibacteria group bacterium]|jgi:nicotinamide mononucleotide transporter